MSDVVDYFFDLTGGLDLVTPAIKKKPGSLIAVRNYEPHPKGLQRIDGYERFDGRPEPSAQSYWVLNFDGGTATIAEGNTVTGASSGATGKALVAMVVSSGSFGASNAAGYLVLTQVSGTFQDNENLQVSAVTKCQANGTATEDGASNDTDDDTWTQDAIETARALIAVPPTASGAIRGGFVLGAVNYCFRDNAGGTAGQLFKQTTSGWVSQSLGSRVKFITGTGEISTGQTVTGASSGATGVVTRVALRTGSYSGGTAVGQLIFATITGTFTNGENLRVGGVTKAVADGDSAAIALPAAGTYRAIVHNFFGQSDLVRAYFTTTTGTAFEWDGTVCVPLITGMTTDTPSHIAEHKNHLMLAFPGGSLQHCSPGAPYEWTAVTGASELGIGEDITGLAPDVAGTMVVFGRNRNSILYGNDVSDWVLQTLSKTAGAVENTMQQIGRPIYLDDAGLRTLDTTADFGDFRLGTITQPIEPLFKTKRAAGVTAVASLRSRAKDQYRIFWSDGTSFTVYLGHKKPEITVVELGITPSAVWMGEDSSGNELLFCGTSAGMVYQLDSGTSADGSAITAYARFAFTHCGAPQINKVWRRGLLEIDASGAISIGVSAELSYGDPDSVPMLETSFSVQAGGGFWDEAVWDQFRWDSPIEGTARIGLDGRGRNISLLIASVATYEQPHIAHGLTLFYSARGKAK